MQKGSFVLFIFAFSIFASYSINVRANVFEYDVYINNADNPSLTFGTATAINQQPAPPYSGMFGVKDIYLANVTTEAPAEWFDRLSTDIQKETTNPLNAWTIISKDNTTLEFTLTDGTSPTNLKVAYYNDPTDTTTDLTVKDLSDGTSLTVKTGGIYVLYQSTRDELTEEETTDITNSISSNSSDDVVFIAKSDDNTLSGEAEISSTILNDEITTITIDINAGNSTVAYSNDDNSNYYYNDRTESTDPAEWVIQVTRNNYSTTGYEWINSSELQVTFEAIRGADTTEEEEELTISMTPKSTSVSPITTEVIANETSISSIIAWVMQKIGTLDFDNNGEIDNNDVFFLYSCVNGAGGFTSPLFTGRNMLTYATLPDGSEDYTQEEIDDAIDALTDEANVALEFFRNNLDFLDFDNNGEINNNDVFFLYSCVNGAGGFTSPLFTGRNMLTYATLPDGSEDYTQEEIDDAIEALTDQANVALEFFRNNLD
ncbi:MAG: hypothetical protein WCQ87_01515 [Parabacteroides sp.]